MSRLITLSCVALFLCVSSASAEQFRGTFVKYEKGQITLKDGDTEKSFAIPTGLKLKAPVKGKLTSKDVDANEALTKLNKSGNKPKMNVVYDNVKEKDKTKEVVRAVQFEP